MSIETIKAGQWVFKEGRTPEYFIYKLLKGKVSIHKSARKLREVQIEEGTSPITLGMTALWSDDRMHTASIFAETDLLVDKLYIEQIRKILASEIPEAIRNDVSTMIEAIGMANALISLKKSFAELPIVEMEGHDALRGEAKELVSEVKRLYDLNLSDVRAMVGG